MELQPFYFNLNGEKKESALGFLVESVLKSRIDLGMKEDPRHSDEDVTIYLAFLLLEASYPAFTERIRHFTSLRNTDVFKMVEDSQDNYFKYLVYKTNADHLLLLLGIFKNLGGDVRGEGAFFEKSQSAYEGYAKTYYQFASEYDRLLHRKVTALGIILSKLSHSFSQYQQILLNVREDYLNFLKTEEENFSRFLKDLDRFSEILHLRELQDLFLDTYSAYLDTKETALQGRLLEIAQKIQKCDPSFKMPPF